MKTIFDYNPTAKELVRYAFSLSKTDYETFSSDVTKNVGLANMLYARNDPEYKTYYDLLPPQFQQDFNRTKSHP